MPRTATGSRPQLVVRAVWRATPQRMIPQNVITTSMAHQPPAGFRFSGAYSGIKRNPDALDISLIVVDQPCVAAGVYTQNRLLAAPVVLCRQRTPSAHIQAVVTNSGNANACTGDQGRQDALRMTRLTAEACGVAEENVLVMSTGIIGESLPMEKISAGIRAAAGKLASDTSSLEDAAKGMLTTDLVTKIASRRVAFGETTGQIVGLAKGSGMIAPNMATTLGVVLTDLNIQLEDAQSMLAAVADRTFNCMSVDGHTSTNDTLLFLASGAGSENELDNDELAEFQSTLQAVCTDLAKAIANDGEGATHLMEIRVSGCLTDADAKQIARTVANSPLVKTAVAGADPNWGRIVSAAGYAGVPFEATEMTLTVNGVKLFERGMRSPFKEVDLAASMKSQRQIMIDLEFASGLGKATFWSSDLTSEYVRINADYHT